jgi:hypothetical protein
MSVITLLLISVLFFVSSLSESLEFIVHNEETLLALCFVAFIFFIFNYLGTDIFDDFQKSAALLEKRLFSVMSEKFKNIAVFSSEFSFMSGVLDKVTICFVLFSYRIKSDWSFFSIALFRDEITSIFLVKTFSVAKLYAQITKSAQNRTLSFLMIPLVINSKWSDRAFISNGKTRPIKRVLTYTAIRISTGTFFYKLQGLKTILN